MKWKLLAVVLPLAVWLASLAGAATDATNQVRPFAFGGNAYDLLQFISYSRNCPVAIDPDTLEALVKTEVEISPATTRTNADILEQSLKPRGFVVQELALTSTVHVAFVTTTDGWTYLQAITAMKRGNLTAMYNLLTSIKDDQTAFGSHCAVLKKALLAITQRNQQMGRLEAEVQDNLASFQRYKNELKMAEVAASRSRNSNPQDANTTLAKAHYDKAVADVTKSFDALDELYNKMVDSNVIIAQAFDAAHSARYTSEAAFLYEHLYSSFARYRSLLGVMQKEGLLKSEKNLGEVPKDVLELRASLRDSMSAAEADLNAASQALAARDYDRAADFYGRAFWSDRSLPLARAGVGHCALQRDAASLHAYLDEADAGARALRIDRLEKEFRDREQLGMLRAMLARRTHQELPAPRGPKTRVGSLNGMAVTRGKGEMFPLSVRIDAIPLQPAEEKKDESSYWENATIKEIRKRDYPVSFGDYGRKDLYMFLAATEAYKWLKGIDGALIGRIGLQVEFRELVSGKGGDSAGVTIASAAYSSLRQVPLRQDVAMTGSVHGDGAVKAVGLVEVKVAQAAISPGIELAIVPEENAADLALLSLEDLCRITIITAKDMRTYLKYAVSLGERTTNEQRLAEAAISRLHDAQALLLAGETGPAQEILAALADGPQEIYNVRRLLGLLVAKRMADGQLAEARALQRQMDDALTKQVLAAPVQDFQIPSTTTTLSANLLAESRQPEVVSPYSAVRPAMAINRSALSVEPAAFLGVLQRILWTALPFPKDSNWSGSKGERAKIEKEEILLRSQAVRTRIGYVSTVTIEFDVSLDERTASDGSFSMMLVPDTAAPDVYPQENVAFTMYYPNKTHPGALYLNVASAAQGSRKLWGDQAFPIEPHKWYHFKLELLNPNRLRITTDERMFEVKDVTIPFERFQIQLNTWQPPNQWRVRSFTVR